MRRIGHPSRSVVGETSDPAVVNRTAWQYEDSGAERSLDCPEHNYSYRCTF